MGAIIQGPPPPGGNQDRGPSVLAVSFVSLGIALITLGLRLYARIKIVGKVGWDDACIVAATAIKWSTLAQAQNVLSTGLVKISICIFLLRILTSKAMARFLYAVIALLVAITAVCFSAVVVQCRPLQKLWSPQVHGKCWGPLVTPKIGRAQGIVSIVTDLICTFCPVIILWRVQISRRTKFGLCGLMSLGLLFTTSASGCCVARVVLMESLVHGDFTWATVDVMIWALLEQNLGIMAACIPAIRPLFKNLFDRSNHSSKVRMARKEEGKRHGPWQFPRAALVSPAMSHQPARASRSSYQPINDISGMPGDAFYMPMGILDIMKTTEVHLRHDQGHMSKRDCELKSHQTMAWSGTDTPEGRFREARMERTD